MAYTKGMVLGVLGSGSGSNLQALLDATLADFSALYARLARLPDIPIAEVQPTERVFTIGDQAYATARTG